MRNLLITTSSNACMFTIAVIIAVAASPIMANWRDRLWNEFFQIQRVPAWWYSVCCIELNLDIVWSIEERHGSGD